MENHAPAAIPQIKTLQLRDETTGGFKTPSIYLEVHLPDGSMLDVEIKYQAMNASIARLTRPDQDDPNWQQELLGAELTLLLDHEGKNCASDRNIYPITHPRVSGKMGGKGHFLSMPIICIGDPTQNRTTNPTN